MMNNTLTASQLRARGRRIRGFPDTMKPLPELPPPPDIQRILRRKIPAYKTNSWTEPMNITWDNKSAARPPPPSSTGATAGSAQPSQTRKLRKKVSFAPTGLDSVPEGIDAPPEHPPYPPSSGGLKGMFKKMSSPKPSTLQLHTLPPPSPTPSDSSEISWHHHESYFPEYEPLFPKSEYKYTNPYETMLTPEEIRRQHHAAVLGEAVQIHYPDLPSWADYKAAQGGKNNWVSGKWGTEGWTGFGWDGETLPNADGQTFGAPMPAGEVYVPPPEPAEDGEGGEGGGKKGKNKKKK